MREIHSRRYGTGLRLGIVALGLACSPKTTTNPATPNTETPAEDPPVDAAAEQALTVTLSPTDTNPTSVVMTVSNPTSATLEFCRYHTPFEGIANNIFVVRSVDGEDIAYRGKMKKRAPPGRSDYVKVRPGKTTSAEVDLAEGWTLVPGEYDVSYRGTTISGLPDSPPLRIVVM